MSRDVTTVSARGPRRPYVIGRVRWVFVAAATRPSCEADRSVRVLDHEAVRARAWRPPRPSAGGSSGQPARGRHVARLEPALAAQRVDQPAPALPVGALEPRLAACWCRPSRAPDRDRRRRRCATRTSSAPGTTRSSGRGSCTPWRRGRASPGSTPSPARPARRVGQLLRLPGAQRPRPAGAGQHPGGVGVDHADVALEGEREHGPGGVGTDARAGPAGRRARRATGRRASATTAGAPVQVDRPAVVAQPGPLGDHLADSAAAAQLPPSGTARGTPRTSASTRADLGLLQHQLADEHRPGVAGAPPRQVAAGRARSTSSSASAARRRAQTRSHQETSVT